METTVSKRLIYEYMIYGLSLEEATECAEQQIHHRLEFEKIAQDVLDNITLHAKEYNEKQDAAKKLSKYQESFKKNTYKQYEKRQQKLDENFEPVGRKYNNARPVIDPNGVYYKTTGEMCAAWGTKLPTYCNRITKGWSMFAALRGKEEK